MREFPQYDYDGGAQRLPENPTIEEMERASTAQLDEFSRRPRAADGAGMLHPTAQPVSEMSIWGALAGLLGVLVLIAVVSVMAGSAATTAPVARPAPVVTSKPVEAPVSTVTVRPRTCVDTTIREEGDRPTTVTVCR